MLKPSIVVTGPPDVAKPGWPSNYRGVCITQPLRGATAKPPREGALVIDSYYLNRNLAIDEKLTLPDMMAAIFDIQFSGWNIRCSSENRDRRLLAHQIRLDYIAHHGINWV